MAAEPITFPDAPEGWTKTDRKDGAIYDAGTRRIYASYSHDDGGVMFSPLEDNVWLPATFSELKTAIASFDLDDSLLVKAQGIANRRDDRRTTAADIELARHDTPGPETEDVRERSS